MREQATADAAENPTIHALKLFAETLDALVYTALSEHRAFVARDSAAILAIAEKKRSLLEDIKRSAHHLTALPEAPEPLRQRIEQSYQRCRELNEVSGRFIAANRDATEKAIAMLRGGVAPAFSYGPRGMSEKDHGSRTLATA